MRAAAHDKEFAKKMGIPQDVAREFVKKDMKKRRPQKPKKHRVRDVATDRGKFKIREDSQS